jgi:S-adenosylmethionine synthetase
MSINNGLFTSESVSAGHPDKLCDRISDTILDEFLHHDPHARVACETMTAHEKIIVTGEFQTSKHEVFDEVQQNADTLVRQALRDIGCGSEEYGIDPDKDPTKVDRSGAYAARWVAKNIVASGLAKRCTIQIAYAIGVSEPVSISVDTHGTGRIDENNIEALVMDRFDLTPSGIIQQLDLLRPIYKETSSLGHFGKYHDPLLHKWECTDILN